MTQRQLAERANMKEAHISKLKSGRIKNPTLGTLLKLKTHLGVNRIEDVIPKLKDMFKAEE